MKRNLLTITSILILAVVLGMFLSGCGKQSNPAVDDFGATSEGVNTIADANNQFAFELYNKYKSEESNIFFSPYSISTSLAMTYDGAKGKTAEEMQSVFHIPEDANIRRSNFAKIYNEINKKGKKYKLSTANALWAQENYKFLEEYTSTVEKYYGGKVTNLDFVREGEKSRLTINTWVEEQTNNKIKDLIPSGAINPDTRLVLTNAIYFKGEWAKQFNKRDTEEQNFRVTPNNNVKISMMQRTDDKAKFNYAETDELQILELPYSGEELSMLILLPKNSGLASLENSLTAKQLSKWKESLKERRVNVFIPKFKFETKYFMAETLQEMGIPTAFSDRADFSGMTGKKDLKIDEVIHQAFVEVNEEGTEAAAATAVSIGITSVSPKPIIPTFRADHPFIFIIRQKDTGNILFLGRVSNPSK